MGFSGSGSVLVEGIMIRPGGGERQPNTPTGPVALARGHARSPALYKL